MNILVLGGGGREHAITWKLWQSDLVKNIFVVPGNPGMTQIAQCISGNILDFNFIETIVKENKIDLIVVGPEAPLVAGIEDYFKNKGVLVFGPSKYASQLEGSKCFSKNILKKYDIPTALFENFDNENKALAFVDYLANDKGFPVVIKADGLAAGKGVVIVQNREEAKKTIEDVMIKKVFGDAGKNVVVEEFLKGEEISIHLVVTGNSYKILPSSQDHKQVFDGDKGPNTGGMGAYSPCPLLDDNLKAKVEKNIIKPLLNAFEKESIFYQGILYIGIMVCNNEPYVLEFNVRLGDPETQVLMPLINTDFAYTILKAMENKLDDVNFELRSDFAVALTCASHGYPGKYDTGFEIKGLEKFFNIEDCLIFHAGTKIDSQNKIVTAGGRVLTLVSLDKTLENSINKAYENLKNINFEGMHYRNDIGKKGLLRREKWINR
ncbi:phosphoribosylamine--glycine ligase [bacterium]